MASLADLADPTSPSPPPPPPGPLDEFFRQNPQAPGITSAQRPPNDMWTAPTAAGGANTSRHAPRLARNAQGQWILTEHGNSRIVDSNQVGNTQSYVDDFWSRNPTGFQAGVGPQRNEDYGAPGGGTGTTPPTTGGAQGATNRFPASSYDWSAFNTARDQDVTRSAKDAFAYGATLGERAGAGTMWHTKQGAEQFANLYLKPYLESQGFQVLGIRGDQINIVTREDREAGNTAGSWFDFVEKADGAAEGFTPRLQWGMQSGTGFDGGAPAVGGAGTGTGSGATTTTPPPASGTSGAPATTSPVPGISAEAYTLLSQRYSNDEIASLASLIPGAATAEVKPNFQQYIPPR